jgi:hypothetical protein
MAFTKDISFRYLKESEVRDVLIEPQGNPNSRQRLYCNLCLPRECVLLEF